MLSVETDKVTYIFIPPGRQPAGCYIWRRFRYTFYMEMVMTVLEGNVTPENAKVLQAKFSSMMTKLPPTIVKTYLVQQSSDPAVWRIVTIWRSQQDLDAMRSQGTPAGVLMFREAGAEPEYTAFTVRVSA